MYYYGMSHNYVFYGHDPKRYSEKAEADIDSLHDYLCDTIRLPEELQDRVLLAVVEMISVIQELNRLHKAYYKL